MTKQETVSDSSEIPESRTCANCACSILQKHPVMLSEDQMFCRRNTVLSQPMRMEQPRLDAKTKEMVIDRRTGKPVMEQVTNLVYLYAPTLPTLTCFDGWRPQSTLPGDKWDMEDLKREYARVMQKLSGDMLREGAGHIEFPTEKH